MLVHALGDEEMAGEARRGVPANWHARDGLPARRGRTRALHDRIFPADGRGPHPPRIPVNHEQPAHLLEPGADPHPNPTRFVARAVSFDHAAGGAPVARLVGIVEAQRFAGYTARGHIPDYHLDVRGKSGATLTISLVESYATFPESP